MPGRARSLLVVSVLVGALMGQAGMARAQGVDALPVDLAALALRPGDVPEPGWKHAGAFEEDLASQAEVVAGYRGDGATVDDVTGRLVSFGWQRMYLDVLDGPPGTVASPVAGAASGPDRRIRSYLTEYETAEGATGGFAYLEDESAISSAEDVPGSRRFGEQSEMTADAGISGIDGRPFRSLDLTFRMGTLVAGVTAITYDSAAVGPDATLVEDLATVLEARIRDKAEVPGLGPMVVRLDDDRHEIVTYDDAYYRIAGVDIPIVDESLSAAARRIATYADASDVYQLWQGVDVGTPAGMLYGATVLRFADEAAADAWLTDLAAILAKNPFYGGLQPLELDADQPYPAIALSYVPGGRSPDAPRALLVAIRAGAVVARVHVVPQGKMTNIPLAAVLALAGNQAACLELPGCEARSVVPTELAPAPAASPVPGT